MVKVYCENCGALISSEWKFCEYCGHTVVQKSFSGKVPSSMQEFSYDGPSHSSPHPQPSSSPSYVNRSTPSYYHPRHPGRKRTWPKVLGVLIVVFIGISAISSLGFIFFGFNHWSHDYEYLGDSIFAVDNSDISNVLLSIDNSVGSVSINSVDDALYPLEVVLSVYTYDDDYYLHEANFVTFDYLSSDTVQASFSSDGDTVEFLSFETAKFIYSLEVSVSSDVSLSLETKVITGSVDVDLSDMFITELYLRAVTGNVDLSLSDSTLATDYASLSAVTGRVEASLDSLTYISPDFAWELSTSTGRIELELNQNDVESFNNSIRMFNIHTSTGRVDIDSNLHLDYGLQIYANCATGSIDLPNGDKGYYSTLDFDNSSCKYYFDLSTSTGSIKFD